MKTCTKCGKQKPLDEFYTRPKRLDGHDSRCKDCVNAQNRDARRGIYVQPPSIISLQKRRLKQRIRDGSFYESNSGCWLWMGRTDKDGYGKLRVGRVKIGDKVPKRAQAHRVSYEVFIGPIPPDMFVCHHCDTPCCVRPDHLFLDTCAGNLADMMRKERSCRGERQHCHKLTWHDIPYIRLLSAAGVGYRVIAKRYGVSPFPIQLVVRNKTWREKESERRAFEEFWTSMFG